MDEFRKDGVCMHINEIIREAVSHGGDMGGSYNSNQEKLVDTMVQFAQWYGLKGYVIVDCDGTPQYAKVICEL